MNNSLSEEKTGFDRSLDVQREEYIKKRFIAVPLAGTIIWALIGIAGWFLPVQQAVWVLFLGTGSIVYFGFFLSKFTGENLLDKNRPKNTFDNLFLVGTLQAFLVFSIALPFSMYDITSVPMSVGILAGLMWLPFSWTVKHWIGFFHTISRTISILVAWYMFPDHRFVIIPAVIVFIYIITLIVLEKRYKEANKEDS